MVNLIPIMLKSSAIEEYSQLDVDNCFVKKNMN